MTTLNVNLSAGMRKLLDLSGVYAYAVYFDPTTGKTPVWQPISLDGSLQGAAANGNVALNLPTTFSGGKVYFLIQSDDPAKHTDLKTEITKQSDINWHNAEKWGVRYDSFEVTLANGINDVGNLTSVEGFGLPMDLSVTYKNGTTASRGYDNPKSPAEHAGNNILSGIKDSSSHQTIYDFAPGTALANADYHRAAISPTQAVGLKPHNPAFSSSDWHTYVKSLENSSASDIAIAGFFNGAEDANHVFHNGGFFSYRLEWDSSQKVFWLSPTDSSQIKGYIKIKPGDLENSIYSTLGSVQIYESKTAENPYTIYKNGDGGGNPADMNTGLNNQWGKVLSQFLTGFTAGFYGVDGQSKNSHAAHIDLDKNWNWDPTYSFGSHLVHGSAPVFMDHYSKVFFYSSNSYGSGYSDSLMSQYSAGGPLLSMYDPGTGQDVKAIDITLYADDEQATGYTPPVIYNYIAPGKGEGGRYDAPHWEKTATGSVTLNFANSGMILNEDVPIHLQILTGYDAKTHDPIWADVRLGSSSVSPWALWNISYADGHYTATAAGTKPDGSLVIGQFPTAVDGTSWYRVVVGDGDAQKVFNLYAETNASGQFRSGAGRIAVDGLATVTAGASAGSGALHTFTVNFMPGSTTTFDPALVHAYTDYNYSSTSLANAPVAGTLQGDVFTAVAGQDAQVSNAISVQRGDLAFGWTGTNNSAGTPSWISGITNKIMGLNTALINITPTTGSHHIAPMAAQADVDGRWATSAMQHLGNGTYNVTMTEYAAKDTTFSHALTPASSLLTVTVNITQLDLHANARGDGISLAGAGAAAGNWVALDALSSSLPPEATLLVYATNHAGQMIGRDGEVVEGLDSAVLAHIGSVASDLGTTLFQGKQMVYLPVGQELHFAIQTGLGDIDHAPAVSVTPQADGTMHLNVGGIQLSAVTNNVLSDTADMASVQRMYDLPLVYLQHGAQVDLDIAGSAANTNHLTFVRLDVDFDTRALSLDGIASDSPDFHARLEAHLGDSGYSADHGGDFHSTTTWTVDGATGFYAPVLVTRSGDIFTIGDDNTGAAEYIRMFGENTFGFEDLTAAQGSDFDYNDMIMRITPHDF